MRIRSSTISNRPTRRGLALTALVAVVLLGAACGSESESDPASLGSPTDAGQSASTTTGETRVFTNADWDEVLSDPGSYAGSRADITGQVFVRPETDGDRLAFQINTDPQNYDGNTVVLWADASGFELAEDDFVRVQGVVGDEFEGENAFGA